MTTVGFVGNSVGLNEAQEKNLIAFLDELCPTVYRHSNGTGAEHQSHYIALACTSAAIIVHEPLLYYGRAMVAPIEPRVTARQCPDALRAHAEVVEFSDVVIFAPADMSKRHREKLLSGFTQGQMQVYASIACRTEPILRMAANLNKKIIVLREDGEVIRYE
jgi:hypothetical protein